MHGDFLDFRDAAGTPIALFIRKPFELQVALMVFIFNFCSFCSLVPRGRRHSTRGACAIARALQDRIRFKRVEELQASRFLGRCWRYFSTQAFGSFILLSFSVRFLFFSHGSYRSILMRDEKYRAVYGKDFIALHFRSLAADIALWWLEIVPGMKVKIKQWILNLRMNKLNLREKFLWVAIKEYFERKSHCKFLVKALQVFRALVYHNTLGVRF